MEPTESPLLKIRRSQANAYLNLVVWVMFPAIAVLLGGGLAVVWWIIAWAWRPAAGSR
jgi:hypothetical protein